MGDDSEGEAAQQRRTRTKFTSEQISRLEDTFSKHKYLGSVQRRKMAEKLNLSETQVGWKSCLQKFPFFFKCVIINHNCRRVSQVKTWFQNRRMKLKREVQDLRPEFLSVPAALFFQHPVLSGQLPAYSSGSWPQLWPLQGTPPPATLHRHRAQPVLIPPHFY